LELSDYRAFEDDLSPAERSCSAFLDLELETVRNAKQVKMREGHRSNHVHLVSATPSRYTHSHISSLFSSHAVKIDIKCFLAERRERNENFEVVTY